MNHVAIDPIMEEVRRRARERLGWGDHPAAYEQVKAMYAASRQSLAPGSPFYPQVLGPEEEWEVPGPLTWESHRGSAGGIIVWLKRNILFPLNRWLFSYTWHNLHRQQRLNLLLLSAVESLAADHARLRQEVEALRGPSAGAGDSPSAPAAEATAQRPRTSRPGRPMKLAFVVDRYGPDIAGGSERHCREFAERLARRGHQVTVLTSCARDYVSWANAFPPGHSTDGPVQVVRFEVAAQRDQGFWHAHSRRVFAGLGSEEDERRWFRESGPYVPGLVEHLQKSSEEHDLFIFFSYRYYPTFAGLPVVARRAILVPTAEEDPAIRLGVLREFFSRPLGIVHNTVEEHALIRSVTRGSFPPFDVIGSGVDEAPAPSPRDESVLKDLGVRPPYVLCLGRVDPNKGSTELLTHFQRYTELEGAQVQLVMAGASVVETKGQAGVLFLGHVTEAQRSALLQNMHALIAPSPFESLSLALLEGWMHGRPALVNGQCKVLRGQVTRANGGLYYDSAGEFREALTHLLDQPETAAALGTQGQTYARREYAWPVVMERLESFLQERLASITPP